MQSTLDVQSASNSSLQIFLNVLSIKGLRSSRNDTNGTGITQQRHEIFHKTLLHQMLSQMLSTDKH